MYDKKIEILNLTLFGYGLCIEFFKGNYNHKTGDGSIKKNSFYYDSSKYVNPMIIFTLNYNYDFKFKLKLNRQI